MNTVQIPFSGLSNVQQEILKLYATELKTQLAHYYAHKLVIVHISTQEK
jgi:hypothetical protein